MEQKEDRRDEDQMLESVQEKAQEIFCCYAREDQALLQRLIKQLTPLKHKGLINIWADTEINAGTEWEKAISEHLSTAPIILLLISPDFMASKCCYGIEMVKAMERHERGEAHVIPIILRPVDWQDAPFGKLQALPKDGRPVNDREWHNEDEAFANVSAGIRKVVEELYVQEKRWLQENKPFSQQLPNKTKLGAAKFRKVYFWLLLISLPAIVLSLIAGYLLYNSGQRATASQSFYSYGFSTPITVALAQKYYQQYTQKPSYTLPLDSPWQNISPVRSENDICMRDDLGDYHVITTSSNHFVACAAPPLVSMSGNFAIQEDAKILKGQGAGLAFGYIPDRTLLSFVFNRLSNGYGPVGNVYLDLRQYGTGASPSVWKCLGPGADSSYSTKPDACNKTFSVVKTADDQTNELTVIVLNGDMYLYVNETPIMAVSHTVKFGFPVSLDGQIGVVAKSGNSPVDVICSQMKYWTF